MWVQCSYSDLMWTNCYVFDDEMESTQASYMEINFVVKSDDPSSVCFGVMVKTDRQTTQDKRPLNALLTLALV